MAKFCTNCGKPLVDGKPCDCVVNQTEMNMKFDVKEFVEVAKGMFTKPADTIKGFVKDENLVSSIILLAMNALIVALCVCLAWKPLMTAGFGGVDIVSAFNVEIPYVKIFLTVTIGVAVSYALLALLFYVIADKLFQGKSSYQKMLALLGCTSIITSVTVLVAMIFSFISIGLMLVFLCTGTTLQMVLMARGFQAASDIDENKLGYVYMITYLLYFFLFLVILPGI